MLVKACQPRSRRLWKGGEARELSKTQKRRTPMSLHKVLCDAAEQRVCNLLIRSIAGRGEKLVTKLDAELATHWLSWKLGDWTADCTIYSLDEFEVWIRN